MDEDIKKVKSMKNQKSKVEEHTIICYVCKKTVSEGEDALQCEMCESWLHIKCVGVTKKLYEVLKESKLDNIHWYCDPCNKGSRKLLTGMTALETRQSKLEEEVINMRNDLEKISVVVAKLDNLNCDVVTNNDAIAKLDSKVSRVDNSLDKLVDIKLKNIEDELKEKERRNLNIIIFGMAESKKEASKERFEDDKILTLKIIKEIKAEIEVDMLHSFTRLGPRSSEKVRPLRFRVQHVDVKNMILKNARNLKGSVFNEVYLSRDLTQKERLERKQLETEFKKRKEEGEEDIIIRGGRIIRKNNSTNNVSKNGLEGGKPPESAN